MNSVENIFQMLEDYVPEDAFMVSVQTVHNACLIANGKLTLTKSSPFLDRYIHEFLDEPLDKAQRARLRSLGLEISKRYRHIIRERSFEKATVSVQTVASLSDVHPTPEATPSSVEDLRRPVRFTESFCREELRNFWLVNADIQKKTGSGKFFKLPSIDSLMMAYRESFNLPDITPEEAEVFFNHCVVPYAHSLRMAFICYAKLLQEWFEVMEAEMVHTNEPDKASMTFPRTIPVGHLLIRPSQAA